MSKLVQSTLAIALLSISSMAMATEHNSREGAAVVGGISNIFGDTGDSIKTLDGERTAYAISGSYTWDYGLSVGGTISTRVEMAAAEKASKWSHANLYAGYTFNNGIKLMAGAGNLMLSGDLKDDSYTGYMLGIGYSQRHFSAEIHYENYDLEGISTPIATFLVGYKW